MFLILQAEEVVIDFFFINGNIKVEKSDNHCEQKGKKQTLVDEKRLR